MSEKQKKAVVFSPHPDDETVGCGATLKKLHRDGWFTFVAIMAPADSERVEKNCDYFKEACKVLDVSDYQIFPFRNNYLSADLPKVIGACTSVIEKIEPQWVFIPHKGDSHQDHRSLFEACVVSTRSIQRVVPDRVLCYEALSSTDQAPAFDEWFFKPNTFVDLTQADIEAKVAALMEYKGENHKFPHPRSREGIEAAARYWGMRCGSNYSEAFVTMKEVLWGKL